MNERDKVPDRGEEPREAPAPYEPPTLTVLGTFHELTREQLKSSGSADFATAFQPAPSHP
jgi:hypothetical protein